MPTQLIKPVIDLCLGDLIMFQGCPISIEGLQVSEDGAFVFAYFYEDLTWKKLRFATNRSIVTIQPAAEDASRLSAYLIEVDSWLAKFNAGV